MKLSVKGQLQLAARAAFAASAAVAFAAPVLVQAQEAEEEAVELETFQVTGSRISRAEMESASPVTVITRDVIIAAGITDVGSLIQRLPSMSGSPIGTTTNNGGNGSVQVDLRGMGVNRTLTLVNGKRTVDGGDYQTIPVTMIERVEILKDGGSAIYGADAVAGVVNIITRKDYDGIGFDVQTNGWANTDGAEQDSYSFIAGKTFTGGNFVFGAEYVTQQHAYQSDAPWDFFQNTYYIYPEGCENQVAAPFDGTPQGGCYPLGSSSIPEGRLRFANALEGGTGQGTFMNPDGGGIVPYDGRTYNYAPVNYIQTPYDRTNLFGEGNFDLTDNIHFNGGFRGNFRQSAQELAPTPYFSIFDPAYDGLFNGVSYSGISEDNYYLRQAVDAYNAANAGSAGFTPLTYQPVTDARRRMEEGTRRFTEDVTQMQVVAGLNGTFSGLDWDVYYNKGYRSRIDRDTGQFAGSRLANALGPSADLDGDGTPECYGDINNPETLIKGCVPLNLFGGPLSVTQEMLDYVGVDLVDTFLTTQDEVGSSLSGRAFTLPGGALGWVVGHQYRGETFEYSPDSGKQIDAVTGNTGVGTQGSLYSNGYFGEVYAPLFDNGAQFVALKGGLRYDDFSRFDGETTWQAGLEVNPISDLKFRATASTVFRAPTIGDLFGGQVDNFPTYTDPCDTDTDNDGVVGDVDLPTGCAQVAPNSDRQVLARVGGNSSLTPETGDTLTAGVVWAPKFVYGSLSTTIDYWQIKIKDGISSLGVQNILDECYFDSNAEFCALITRNDDYSVAQIVDKGLNVAEQGAEGVDTEVRYSVPSSVGRFETAVLWTHLLERTKVAFAGEPEVDLSGRYTDPTAEDGGAYATDKVNYSLSWYWDRVTVGYLGQYIGGLDADTFCNCGPGAAANPEGKYIQKIAAVRYHDVYAGYDFPWGMKIQGGITNVTNEAPPFIEQGFNAATDPSTYRVFGRGYYVRLSQKF